MDICKFQSRLTELVEQLTEQKMEEAALSLPFSELGVDSLMALELAVYLEREFGIRLTEEELAAIGNLQDIVNIAKAKGNG